ncbi:sugar transferase [Xylanimonas ulmi]|uniref:Undecaprenyl-phosphate galactose phosphotransferase WbaP/exopolysaccharide biosynthesis polyprenyl glycosylphosphotransferase n=1 Tax=Xylanimonas ulmi TaxID=228973 RepID=A0A4Q7M7H4_9MICO|nr:sugar transferase [Xylanibacterium ulmi]RZS62608.1 Undecaprenyl-phosphate galactose phosphotransferase WbaP/exopolysaccharide biosynthesis polyprenyl glycosylphosphotransferase [Xylanibacterium ulmi]
MRPEPNAALVGGMSATTSTLVAAQPAREAVARAARSAASAVAWQPRRPSWRRRLALALLVTDAAAITTSLVVAYLVRFGATEWSAGARLPYGWVGVLLGLAWVLTLARSRDVRAAGIGLLEYQRVIGTTVLTFGALAIVAFLARLDIARGYLAVALPVGLVLLVLGRWAWRLALQRLRRADRCLTGAIVAGPAAEVARVAEQLRANLRAGYRPIAVSCSDAEPLPEHDAAAHLPAVPFAELVDVARRSRTRAVIIAGELPGGRERVRELGWSLEDARIELILVSQLTDVAAPRVHLRPLDGLPMVHVDLAQRTGVNHVVKRTFDVAGALLALTLLSPVLAAVAIAIKLDDGGPVVFRQVRVCQHGGRFTMYKFRSMVVDAEQRLGDLAQANEGAGGVLFKVRADPRITRVGGLLRRGSLDELPQLWNVLRGDMSLVGPRPPLPREVELYERPAERRLLTKPGVTGLWQVSGRSRLTWEESVRLDLYYVENWSLALDLLVLARTFRAVVKRDGAY